MLKIGDTVVSLKTDSNDGNFKGNVETGRIYTVTKLFPYKETHKSCIGVDGQAFGFYEKDFIKIIGGKKMRTLEELKVTITETEENFKFEVAKDTPIDMHNGVEIVELYTVVLERVKESKFMDEEQMVNCISNVVCRFNDHLGNIRMHKMINKMFK